MKLDDRTLVAYVDGELGTGRSREIRIALSDDTDARVRVQIFRATSSMMRDAFAEFGDDAGAPR